MLPFFGVTQYVGEKTVAGWTQELWQANANLLAEQRQLLKSPVVSVEPLDKLMKSEQMVVQQLDFHHEVVQLLEVFLNLEENERTKSFSELGMCQN